MTAYEEALADVQYAKQCGVTALEQHFKIWFEYPPETTSPDHAYYLALRKIKDEV